MIIYFIKIAIINCISSICFRWRSPNIIYESEIKIRKELRFPPFCDLVVLTVHSDSEALVNSASLTLTEMLDRHLKEDYNDVPAQLFGPFESPVYKAQNVYRLRLVIKCKLSKRSRNLFNILRTEFPERVRSSGNSSAFLTCDFNPTNI